MFGHFDDKYGRKLWLIFILLTVGIGIIGISVLSSATAIGLAAPILLLIFRGIQGTGFGEECGGAATWILEVTL
jgi:MFS family permease